MATTGPAAHHHDSLDDADDDALMAAFARGDAAAFERLYRRHGASLYRFVRRLLGPSLAAQADEVFQDTWHRVVRARDGYRARGSAGGAGGSDAAAPTAGFRTWLFTLAHHRAIDCLRASGRELPIGEPDDDADRPPYRPDGSAWSGWPAADGAPAHDEQLFWRRAGMRLLDCLEQLPAAQKTAFLLHHEDGLGVAELASALGLGFETAKSRLRYAMTRLRVCMGAYLPAEERQ